MNRKVNTYTAIQPETSGKLSQVVESTFAWYGLAKKECLKNASTFIFQSLLNALHLCFMMNATSIKSTALTHHQSVK